MKNNSKILIALLCAGSLAFGGCGASDTPKGSLKTAAQLREENAQANTDADTQTAPETSETNEGTAAGSSDAAIDANLSADTNAGSDANLSADTNAGSDADTTADTNVLTAGTEVQTGVSSSPEIPAPHVTAQTDIETGERHSVVGIVTDATTYSIAIQVPDGSHYYLTIPETGVTGNISSITIGQLATLTYVGSLDENHATLIDISDSSMITGIYLEEYAFALQIIDACVAMDLEALSDLTNFPVFLETGNHSDSINTSGEFEAIDNEKVFTEALINRMANFNLFDLKYTDAGFVMGNGTPSITFDVDEEGVLGIIGINCNPAPTKSED